VRLSPIGMSTTIWPIVPAPKAGCLGAVGGIGMSSVIETEVPEENLPQSHFNPLEPSGYYMYHHP
jgi:hypothetical protein